MISPRCLLIVATNLCVSIFFLLFVYINVLGFVHTGEPLYFLVSFNESLYVCFYLIRRDAVATSHSYVDWGVAFSATFLSTLLRPGYSLLFSFATALVAAGTILTILAALSLNRSMAIVPAQRRIRTKGAYTVVRHPMYAAEILGLLGYVLGNLSFLNAGIALCTAVLLVVRAEREERFLSRSEEYREYRERVKYKLLPPFY